MCGYVFTIVWITLYVDTTCLIDISHFFYKLAYSHVFVGVVVCTSAEFPFYLALYASVG